MRWEWRKDRSGNPHRSFCYYDPVLKKNVRLKKEDIPTNIDTDEKAEDFCRLKESQTETTKLRILKKLEWEKQFHDFPDYIKLFSDYLVARGDRTPANTVYYAKQYVLPFFLTEMKSNLMTQWPNYYEEFRDWLLQVKKSKLGKTDTLAYSTRNHIISALNTFLNVMYIKKKILEPVAKCTKFPSYKLNQRDLDDVLAEEEAKLVHEELLKISVDAADFFLMLLNTGLRLSEGIGISVSNVNEGLPSNAALVKSISIHSLACYGYISINSQVDDPNKYKNVDGTIKRVPLKGRKKITSREIRSIPISDKTTFNMLVDRFDIALKISQAKDEDKLLFDGLTDTRFRSALVKAYNNLKIKFRFKSAHCLRHTFSTHFAGKTTGDFFLCKLVLGHKDVETTQKYVHIFESIFRDSQKQQLKKTGLKKVK